MNFCHPEIIIMKTFLALAALLLVAPLAHAQLEWRISVKLIADSGGNPAPNAFNNISNELVLANQLLDGYGRGYRFDTTEILTLTGVSQWYNIQARNNSNKLALQAVARANPSLYAWRNNAINLYVVNSISGVCSFSGDGDELILVGANAYRTLVLHECGHYFNLNHTHVAEQFLNANNSACTNGCACARLLPGDMDGVGDTAPDHECFSSQDAVALGAYGNFYTNLNATQQWLTRNTWQNIMSYHDQNVLSIETPDQLDRSTDSANGPRLGVTTGRTRYVATWGSDAGGNLGTASAARLRNVSTGVARADAGDIVLIAGGAYNEPQTLSKAVTLRATRGDATIGAP